MNKLLTCMLLLSFLLSGCQNAVENPAIAPSDPPLSSAGEPAETENSTEESQSIPTTVPQQEETKPTGPTEPEPPAAAETAKPTEAPTEAEPKPTETTHTHSYQVSTVPATCIEQGCTIHSCSCGDSYRDAYTDALGHSYSETVIPATEWEEGYTKHACSRCGYSYTDNYTPVVRVEIITEEDILVICAEACAYAESLGLRIDPTAASWTASCCCSRYSGGYMDREAGLAYIRKTYFEDIEDFAQRGYSAFYPLYWADGDDWRFVGAFWW